MSANPLLSLAGVDMHFAPRGRAAPVLALNNINLTIYAGERVALVGANGCGKSTLLRVLHGLLKPQRGSVERVGTLRQAMLFQRPHMLRTSAQNNIALGLWLQGRSWARAKDDAWQALERVGLQSISRQHAPTLSGGQQQRLALARAWAIAPDALLLDEPTASLDPHAKREVEALLHEFALGPSMTLVFASHNLGQVKRLASRVIYLERGRILADLPVRDFFEGDRLRQVSEAAHLFIKGELA